MAFTIIVNNVGTVDATGVVVSDTLPAGLILVDATTTKGTVAISGNHFEVTIGVVAPGEVITIVAHAAVSLAVQTDSVLVNVASLHCKQADRQASAQVTIRQAGACPTPGMLPITGSRAVEARGGVWPWLFVAGLLLLLVGLGLVFWTHRRPSAGPS